ncbi:MAG TPA: fibronectin type III domain-containing protein, partial [Acidimicrobiales bacterium]
TLAAAIAVALSMSVVVAPGASGVTAPTVVAYTVAPAAADVTAADGVFSVTLRMHDPDDVVSTAWAEWQAPANRPSGAGSLTKGAATGEERTWTGTFAVPRYAPAGRYPLSLTTIENVHDFHSYSQEDLAAGGHSTYIDITDSDPDTTPPRITALSVTPSTVDVRGDAATVEFEMTLADDKAGVTGVGVLLSNPAASSGGASGPFLSRTSGTAQSGTWKGTATIPEHARQGTWTFTIIIHDRVQQAAILRQAALSDAGFPSSFEVVSEEDVEAPVVPWVTVEPAELNVHSQDRTVNVRVRVTDNLSGVAPVGSYHHVGIVMDNPTSWNWLGSSLMERESGTDLDGIYKATFTVPAGSPTGHWPLRLTARDRVLNYRFLAGSSLEAAGAPASILVYNTPLSPTSVSATPGDGSVTVRWGAPADERGAAVTEYVVRESPGGAVVRVVGSAREAVVGGLANGTAHTFTVAALNKAGESEPSAAVAASPRRAPRSGYWMVGSGGDVFAFGDARHFGNAPVGGTPAVDLEPTPNGDGYWIVDAAGHVFALGAARHHGGASGLAAGELVTSLSATPDGGGYWLFTNRGRVLPFGNAPFLGDMSKASLNGPVLDSVSTPSGKGYYMVASDGGVFAFGDARFAGSMASTRLNAPVQSLVPDPDGSGYWLVASDGGIFAFGAPFHGSMGSARLTRPVTGMVGSPTGGGYLMVAEDGGIFAFG